MPSPKSLASSALARQGVSYLVRCFGSLNFGTQMFHELLYTGTAFYWKPFSFNVEL